MNSPPEVAILVLTFNQAKSTLRCLTSLAEVKEPQNRVLLWDNGSSDGTIESVKRQFPEVLVHRNPSNLGVASGRNAAAKMAVRLLNPRFLMFLDNDSVVKPEFLSELLKVIDTCPRVAQVQPKLRLLTNPDRLDDGGGCGLSFWRGATRPVGFGEVDRGQYDRIRPCVGGGCTLVRAEVFEELDGFDARFDPYGPEDIDFSLRLSKENYLCLFVPQAVIFHDRRPSEREYSESYAFNRAKHWLLFLRKHATILESIGFFLVGAPIIIFRVLFREGRRGNLKAFRGLVSGTLSQIRG